MWQLPPRTGGVQAGGTFGDCQELRWLVMISNYKQDDIRGKRERLVPPEITRGRRSVAGSGPSSDVDVI